VLPLAPPQAFALLRDTMLSDTSVRVLCRGVDFRGACVQAVVVAGPSPARAF
jgi:hypothetical protein